MSGEMKDWGPERSQQRRFGVSSFCTISTYFQVNVLKPFKGLKCSNPTMTEAAGIFKYTWQVRMFQARPCWLEAFSEEGPGPVCPDLTGSVAPVTWPLFVLLTPLTCLSFLLLRKEGITLVALVLSASWSLGAAPHPSKRS